MPNDADVPSHPAHVTAEGFDQKEGWLRARESGIGASEVPSLFAAEIAACNEPAPFMSEFELYARKTGAITDPVVETQRMRMGARFEGGIADEFADMTKLRVVSPGPTPWTAFRNRDAGMLFATPDRFVLLPGGWGALEVKRTGDTWSELPLRVQLQVQAQLAVLAMREGRVAACMARDEVLPFEVAADTELAAMIVERVTLFWKRVVAREPPEPIAADREVVRKLYPRHASGKVVQLDPFVVGVGGGEYEHARACVKTYTEQMDAAAAKITAAMGDAEVAEFPCGTRFSWKTQKRAAYTVPEGELRVLRVLKDKIKGPPRLEP